MKLDLIVAHEAALKSLAQIQLKDAQLAWDMSEALEFIGKAAQKFHDKRNELIKKYGKADPDRPEEYQITDLAGFNKEVNALLEVEIKVKFPKLTLTSLNGTAVSPADMIAWKAMKLITK